MLTGLSFTVPVLKSPLLAMEGVAKRSDVKDFNFF